MRNLGRMLPRALLAAVIAQVAAAALVLYLQTIVAEQQHKEAEAILQRLCNESLAGTVSAFRDSLHRPHLEVLSRATAGYLMSTSKGFDIPTTARTLSAGLKRTDPVDRYFIWSEGLPAPLVNQ